MSVLLITSFIALLGWFRSMYLTEKLNLYQHEITNLQNNITTILQQQQQQQQQQQLDDDEDEDGNDHFDSFGDYDEDIKIKKEKNDTDCDTTKETIVAENLLSNENQHLPQDAIIDDENHNDVTNGSTHDENDNDDNNKDENEEIFI